MNGQDDLRAVLQGRRDEDDATAKKQAQLDLDRQAYEREEEAVKARLREAGAAMLGALVRSGTTREIPIGEKPYGLGRLFRSQEHVMGWEIGLPGGERRILCTDGLLVSAASYPGGPPPQYTPLNEWIDRQIEDTRSEFQENGFRDLLAEAFRANVASRGYGSAVESELRSRLSRQAEAITRAFASVLHERGIEL